MGELFGGLVLLALIVGLIVCTFMLPIIAFVRTRRIDELIARLERLEKRLGEAGPAPTPAAARAPEKPPEPPAAKPPWQEPVWTFAPVSWRLPADAARLEAWLGRHALGWTAVVLLLFATGFFLARVLARGEWRRRAGSKPRPMEIEFSEAFARRLWLVVTDYRNPPLTITAVRYTAAARQVVFAASESLASPLLLYAGNPAAQPPRYDFAANLPATLDPSPVRTSLSELEKNPIYQPQPKPLAQRWPWLVYVVLGIASVILLGILAVLARQALVQYPASLEA